MYGSLGTVENDEEREKGDEGVERKRAARQQRASNTCPRISPSNSAVSQALSLPSPSFFPSSCRRESLASFATCAPPLRVSPLQPDRTLKIATRTDDLRTDHRT